MADWRTLSFQGYTVVSRQAAVFEVGPPLPEPLPFASFTVKVLERSNGSFAAHLNVAVRGSDGHPDWHAGLGETPDEALEDALKWFWQAVQDHGASRAEDLGPIPGAILSAHGRAPSSSGAILNPSEAAPDRLGGAPNPFGGALNQFGTAPNPSGAALT